MSPAASSETDQNANAGTPVEAEAAIVLRDLRIALAGILDRLGPRITRPTDLHRLLRLDHRLSWSIFNAATVSDARTLPSLLPGRRAMERFFTAAAERAVAQSAIDQARAAFERFEESVARHARSRDAFQTMIATMGSASGEPAGAVVDADARHKRSMFRAASLLWGREARVGFTAVALHPSPRPGLLDRLTIRGMIGLHQTRPGVPLHTVARHWRKPTAGDPVGPVPVEAIDRRESAPEAIGLLQDFCSQPLPRFRAVASDEGFTSHELVATAIGASSEISYFTGHVAHACATVPGSVLGSEITWFTAVDLPIQVDFSDIFMHESVWDDQAPEVTVYGWPKQGSLAEFRDSERLPVCERAVCLGRAIDSGWTPNIPRYADMLSYAMERVGWDPREFRLFRCRVDHPLLHSRIRMRFARWENEGEGVEITKSADQHL